MKPSFCIHAPSAPRARAAITAALLAGQLAAAPAIAAPAKATPTAPAPAKATPTAPAPAPARPADPSPAPLPEKGRAPDEKDLAKAQKTDERPWARGVTDEQQQRALVAFGEGNNLLRDALFVKAAEKYREALRSWDHPAIHYNLALALVNLDQPVEMYLELGKAMIYGDAPLDPDKFERARGYKLLVEGQLAHFEISCDTPGARVFLDGKELFAAPGKQEGLVRIGEHTVLARGTGFAPSQLSQKLGPGEVMRLHLKLFTDSELTRYKRKMPTWAPWATLGAGAAIVGGGFLLRDRAQDDYAAYDAAIAECAGGTPQKGCANTSVSDRKDRAGKEQLGAVIAWGIGGAVVATGLTLVILNRAESYRIDPFAERASSHPVSLAPVVAPDHVGFIAQGRF